jgi:peptidoglycan/xylan/chitin deacetylase (PgdA/CDA1 family)
MLTDAKDARAMDHPGLGNLTSRLVRGIGNTLAPRGKGAGRLCILTYHRVLATPDPLLDEEPDSAAFRWQMQVLAECFNVLPLHDAVHMLASERMPPRAVAITFDDGYRSVHDLALPILCEYALPATVFVTSGCLDAGCMWNDIILEAIRAIPGPSLDLRAIGLGTYSLDGETARKQTMHTLIEHSKYLPPARRLELTGLLQRLAGQKLPSLMLDREMVVTLRRAGIEVGGHTVTHPILTRLADDSAMSEIVDNKRDLEAVLGAPLRLFAYPNGKLNDDFDARHMHMVKQAGYSAAVTTAPWAATGRDDPFAIPRSRPWDKTPAGFAARLLYWLSGRRK